MVAERGSRKDRQADRQELWSGSAWYAVCGMWCVVRGESCMALRRVPLWGTAGGSLAALGCVVRGVCGVSPCQTAARQRPHGGQRVARWREKTGASIESRLKMRLHRAHRIGNSTTLRRPVLPVCYLCVTCLLAFSII